MDATLTTSLLSAKNNSDISTLPGNEEVSDLLSGEGFATDLASAWQEMMATDGKLNPPDLAALNELNSEQLADLASQSAELSQAQLLSASAKLKDDSKPFNISNLLTQPLDDGQQNPVANPAASALLNMPTEISNALSNDEQLDLDNLISPDQKKTLVNSSILKDVFNQAQGQTKNDSYLSQVLDNFDSDLAQQMGALGKSEVDLTSNIFDKQDFNATKLVAQLSSIDRPFNASHVISHHSLQTTGNQDQAGTSLRRIEVPVQQPGWGQAVGDRLLTMVNDKIQSAHIHLNPPELGPIEVRVNINHDQASVHFVSSHTAVRDAIEEAFPRLKDMFMQNGINLTDANVSQHSQQQQAQHYPGEQNHNSATPFNNNFLDSADTIEEVAQTRLVDLGLIDQYV